MFVWGANEYGELGLGEGEENMFAKEPKLLSNKETRLACVGTNHTILHQENGELLVFGKNSSCQLGLGDYEHRRKPTLLVNDKNIRMIAAGEFHSFYLSDDKLFGFGNKSSGEQIYFKKSLYFYERKFKERLGWKRTEDTKRCQH